MAYISETMHLREKRRALNLVSFIRFIQGEPSNFKKNEKAKFSKIDTRFRFIQGFHRMEKNEKAKFSKTDTRWLCFSNTKWLITQKPCISEQNGGHFF